MNLEKEELIKPKASWRQEIQIRAEINEIENKKTIEKNQWNQTWLIFEKLSKIGKSLSMLTTKKLQKTQITNVRNGREAITTHVLDIRRMKMKILWTLVFKNFII